MVQSVLITEVTANEINKMTRTDDHFDIPTVTSDLGKTGIKCIGAIRWIVVAQ